LCRGCVKTLTKIFGQKIDRLERHTSDDRHLGDGFGTPNLPASLINCEVLHRLCPLLTVVPGQSRHPPNLTARSKLSLGLRSLLIPVAGFSAAVADIGLPAKVCSIDIR
jgi:hypothetical protein